MHKSILAASAALALSALGLAGCTRDEQADVAALSRYTPENLSQELLLRYKATLGKPGAANSNKGSTKAKEAAKISRNADGEKEKSAEAKYGVDVHSQAPKAAEKGVSVEDLAKNVARKIKLVEGETPQAVLAKINKAVDADPDLSLADKDKLQDALNAALDK